ncbi:MAG: orotidine 5'-phosphate decarboxylase [Candidatus Poribacteria bacterium]|nr:orotidine 5'-phosphate decarboxylase [Candidatus Poribacteria bacterium]
MKLQLALDLIDCQKAKRILEKVVELVDIVEIGTPLLMKEGVKAATEIKQAYPSLEVLADLKIVDAGDQEARLGFDAGADIVTVLGVAHDITIRRVVDEARVYNRQVMVDLIAVDAVQKRARELDTVGVDYICVHTAFDIQAQGMNPLRELQLVQPVLKRARVAVAGGIKPEVLPPIASYRPEIVVVGGFITGHPDPRQAALEIRKLLDSQE